MLLCTSLKKGMLFRERGLVSGKSPNQLILTLIEVSPGFVFFFFFLQSIFLLLNFFGLSRI